MWLEDVESVINDHFIYSPIAYLPWRVRLHLLRTTHAIDTYATGIVRPADPKARCKARIACECGKEWTF